MPIPRSFPLHALCLLVSGALLTACGSSDSVAPPVTPPPAPEPPLTLLAESVVSKRFTPGGIALDAAGTIYVGNSSADQLPLPNRDKPTFEVMKISQGGAVSAFVDKDSAYSGPATSGTIPERVIQLAFHPASQTLYALNIGGIDTSFVPGLIRPITSAGVVGAISLAETPTHPGRGLFPGFLLPKSAALALGPDGALNAYGVAASSSFGTPTTGSYHMDYAGWQVVNPDGTGRIMYSQESGERTPGREGPGAYSYTYPADLGATGGRLGRNEAGLALDSAGNAYIADTARHAIVKLTPAGSASILAGAMTQPGSADGSGAAARFKQPTQLVVDKANNVFVLDRGNATVRKITPAGVVSTVLGVAGQSQTKVGELPGGLGAPVGLAMDGAGRLYVTVDKGVLRARLP